MDIEKINAAFASINAGADLPGMPARSNLLQVPSDNLREAAKQFVKRAIGLVPDPAWHVHLVDVLHDVVVSGDKALQKVLETRADFVQAGHVFDVEHAAYRVAGMEYVTALRDQVNRIQSAADDLAARLNVALTTLDVVRDERDELRTVLGQKVSDGGTQASNEEAQAQQADVAKSETGGIGAEPAAVPVDAAELAGTADRSPD